MITNFSRRTLVAATLLLISVSLQAQIKILFDATKAETASNADWIIDADQTLNGEANAQRYPTPDQSTVTASTLESYWKGGISSWGIDLVKKGYWVETLPIGGKITYGTASNLQDLSNYKVFVVCEPNILFTAAEKTALMQFVQNGGGLFMVSDHDISDRNNDGADSPFIWNDFMSTNSVKANPFGITFDYEDIREGLTTNIPILPNDPLLNGVMGTVTQAEWFNGTTMTLTPTSNSSVKGVVYRPGSAFGNTDAMVAYATYGNGKVVGVGDSSPCDDGSGDTGDNLYDGWITDASGNHRKLIMNATIWLATSTLTVTPSNQNVMVSAGSTTFDVISNTSWTCSSDASWCVVTPSGNGNGTLSASYLENTAALSRTATILVSAIGAPTQTIKVVQSASFVSIEENTQNSYLLFPNPTSGVFKITGNAGTSDDMNITILESSGRLVNSYHSSAKSEYTFDLSAYPKGMYIVKAETGGKLITWKLSLQ
ncbi:MAG: T9SS type A sorting domain-containing protein [Bacteroidales bacterium]|nr:T9SS type A sorting domain-containing protein [Bacteroidales bacterium]